MKFTGAERQMLQYIYACNHTTCPRGYQNICNRFLEYGLIKDFEDKEKHPSPWRYSFNKTIKGHWAWFMVMYR